MTMTLTTFKSLLDVYGTDFSRWPAENRDSAVTILATSSEAQDAYQKASVVDKLFAPAQTQEPPSGLLEKIISASKKDGDH